MSKERGKITSYTHYKRKKKIIKKKKTYQRRKHKILNLGLYVYLLLTLRNSKLQQPVVIVISIPSKLRRIRKHERKDIWIKWLRESLWGFLWALTRKNRNRSLVLFLNRSSIAKLTPFLRIPWKLLTQLISSVWRPRIVIH